MCGYALHCHLWPVLLYNIFPHYLKSGKIFGKRLVNIKYIFILILTNVKH